MKVSVIISTYNSEEWLEKVLYGYSVQTEKDFELIIADDGSTEKTKQLIANFKSKLSFPIVHVWQEDNGFQKTEILNKAITASTSEYLIFSDGDCIPRKDFIAAHVKHRKPGIFLSGGYFKLPMSISKVITSDDILNQKCFELNWLKKNGLKSQFKNVKFIANGFLERLLNFITTTKPTWNGHNASGWKKDIIAINGFNQEMQYGGEDREFGERLRNFGISPKQIRYSAICIHLDHDRCYANEESKRKNMLIRKQNKINNTTYIENGIK